MARRHTALGEEGGGEGGEGHWQRIAMASRAAVRPLPRLARAPEQQQRGRAPIRRRQRGRPGVARRAQQQQAASGASASDGSPATPAGSTPFGIEQSGSLARCTPVVPPEVVGVDVIVIGGGPVGMEVASLARGLGKSVLVAEVRGCLLAAPTATASKALREASCRLGAPDGSRRVPWGDVQAEVNAAIARAVDLTERRGFAGAKPKRIDVAAAPHSAPSPSEPGPASLQMASPRSRGSVCVVATRARFAEGGSGDVLLEYAGTGSGLTPWGGAVPCTVRAPLVFLATGSHAARPSVLPWDSADARGWLFDSDSVANPASNLGFVPEDLVVHGGGMIGTEYAAIMRGLGARVTLVCREDELLVEQQVDEDVVVAIRRRMENLGIDVRLAQDIVAAIPPNRSGGDSRGSVRLTNGDELKCDALLSCVGRVGTSEQLGLDSVGLHANGDGKIEVDSSMCCGILSREVEEGASGGVSTTAVYAIGDLAANAPIEPVGISSTGLAQAHLALRRALESEFELAHPKWPRHIVRAPPVMIWTEPTIAFVGMSAARAVELHGEAEVGSEIVHFNETTPSITHPIEGFLKLVYRVADGRVLGVHVVGNAAEEIIHHAAVLVNANGYDSIYCLIAEVPAGHTYSEAFRIAAVRAAERVEDCVDSVGMPRAQHEWAGQWLDE